MKLVFAQLLPTILNLGGGSIPFQTNSKKTVGKVPVKPQPKLIREVLGTTPLVGYEGKLNQTFTLGKETPFNFTLRSAEYTVGRVNIGTDPVSFGGDEKLLVLHFTAQNSMSRAFSFSTSYLNFIAVDASGVSRKYINNIAREVTGEPVNLTLNPGQKIDAYTVIKVGAFGAVPKLIVKHAYEDKAPIVRYDLRGVAKKLPAPYADPSDKSGATALKTVEATSGTWYPVTDFFDARLEKVEYSTNKFDGRELGAGNRYCIAMFTIRNGGKRAVNMSSSDFRADLNDVDGEKTNYNNTMLKGSRDEAAFAQVEPGEETRVRFFWQLPEKVDAQTVLLKYGYNTDSRTFAFPVAR